MASPSSSRSADFDLIVLGAGSGGLASAKRAASYGARVAIVEADRVGGTCVIRGCIPKKLMVYAAEMHGALADAAGYGWADVSATHDWSALVTRRNAAVERLERLHEAHLASAGVELLRGRATVAAADAVRVGERTLRTRYVLIATGAAPVLPAIDGIEHAMTSEGFFELADKPERISIVGGGYIAVEFASILTGLGCEVALLIRRDLPLRTFDDDLRAELLEALRTQGVDVRTNTTVESIARDPAHGSAPGSFGRVHLRLHSAGGPGELVADQALVYAVGRRPKTAVLGLEQIGVEVGERGEIVVDDDGVSSVPSILAVGDVTGRVALTPVAIQAGRALADRVFGGKPARMSYENVPTAVFSDPPIGTVGLTESEARTKLGEARTKVFKSRFTPLIHSLTDRTVTTLVKMIVDADTDRVVGCHMIGRDAPEIIQGMAVAMKAGATKADFDATVGIHPSSAEEFVTLT